MSPLNWVPPMQQVNLPLPGYRHLRHVLTFLRTCLRVLTLARVAMLMAHLMRGFLCTLRKGSISRLQRNIHLPDEVKLFDPAAHKVKASFCDTNKKRCIMTHIQNSTYFSDSVLGALHPAEAAQLRGRRRHREAVPGGGQTGLLHGNAPEERHTVHAGQRQRAATKVGTINSTSLTTEGILGCMNQHTIFTQPMAFYLDNHCIPKSCMNQFQSSSD